MTLRSVPLSTGSYLPDRILTNAELADMVATDDSWIRQRTGIAERRIAADDEWTSDLGAAAARKALDAAGLKASDIDLVIVATATPDRTFPATAVAVQEKLGMTGGTAFDLQAVCSGFVFAVSTADALLRTGGYRRALIIGAEIFSRILDWDDRTTCVLFGDGAGAMILEAQASDSVAPRGVLSSALRSDGRHQEKLYVDGGPASTGTVGKLRMEGREVFKFAVALVSDVIADALDQANVAADEVDWFVPHQANLRIIDATAKRFDWPSEKVVRTVATHGNTSAASIPLALDVAVRDGRIKPGDLVMMEAMGGGFTWGASLIRW